MVDVNNDKKKINNYKPKDEEVRLSPINKPKDEEVRLSPMLNNKGKDRKEIIGVFLIK